MAAVQTEGTHCSQPAVKLNTFPTTAATLGLPASCPSKTPQSSPGYPQPYCWELGRHTAGLGTSCWLGWIWGDTFPRLELCGAAEPIICAAQGVLARKGWL